MSNSINLAVPQQAIELPEFWNMIFISGDITSDTALEVSHKLLTIEMLNKANETAEPVNMFINSPGGDLNAAWQICDVMDFICTPVHTVGIGQVCSAGLIITMNGHPGERKITDRTSIMSHTYTWGSFGSHGALISATKEMDYIHKRMIQHYMDCTGLERKVITEELLTDLDKWLTPQQAKKYNLVDQVVICNKSKRLKAKSKNKSKKK